LVAYPQVRKLHFKNFEFSRKIDILRAIRVLNFLTNKNIRSTFSTNVVVILRKYVPCFENLQHNMQLP